MPWTAKRRHSCYTVAEPEFNSRGGLAWTLRSVVIGLLLVFALVGIPRVNAGESYGSNIAWIPSAGESAQPTDAWSEFCERSPGECAIDPSEPATIKLDDHDMEPDRERSTSRSMPPCRRRKTSPTGA